VIDRYEHLGRLVTDAISRLEAASPWLVLSTTPTRPAQTGSVAAQSDELRRWVRQQAADWPAPIPVGSEPPVIGADKLTFTPPHPPGEAERYFYQFHSDGSALGGLQIGALRDSDGQPVWALGEGAVAWLVIAMLRVNAAFARRLSVTGEAEARVTVVPPAASGPAVPLEVWNHAGGTYGPAGGHRAGGVDTSRRTVDLAACLSSSLPAVARTLLLDVLGQFGVTEPRHIGVDGVIRRRHFTGHGARIAAWAESIGVPSAP